MVPPFIAKTSEYLLVPGNRMAYLERFYDVTFFSGMFTYFVFILIIDTTKQNICDSLNGDIQEIY